MAELPLWVPSTRWASARIFSAIAANYNSNSNRVICTASLNGIPRVHQQTVDWILAASKGWIKQTYRKIMHTQNHITGNDLVHHETIIGLFPGVHRQNGTKCFQLATESSGRPQ